MTITLDYGPQGTQQAGDAIVLRYGTAGALRRVAAGVAMPWRQAEAVGEATTLVHGRTTPRDTLTVAPWGAGVALAALTVGPYSVATPADARRRAPWGRYGARPAGRAVAPWVITHARDRRRRLPWGRHAHRPALAARVPWGIARTGDTRARLPWGVYATAAVEGVAIRYARPVHRDHWRRLPWALWAKPLAPGWGVVVEDGEPVTDPDTGQILIPARRVYLVSNTANLILQPSGDVLPLLAMTVSIDTDAWTWSLRAELHGSAWPQVRPGSDPVEVEAQVNGYTLRFVVDSARRSRAFNERSVSVTGRGHAAWLARPYAPAEARTNDSLQTAQQLIIDALEFTDWGVDWQLTDWNVPAGAFSQQGTPMDVATRVATAAGGIVQADRTAKTLHVLPRYPTPPWDWPTATPDVQVPLEIVTTESVETVERPSYSTVYVAGESQGIVGHITRDGTAGDQPAPMVTDALITELAAARQRGTAILADTGAQLRQQISLPITDEAPLLEVGWLTEFADPAETLLGLVRAISVEARRQGGGALVVRQNAELEVH